MNGRIQRRDFLKIIGAGTALAGCSSEPVRHIIPYVVPPEGVVPGVSTYYKSTCRECPAGCGLVVRTREGRVLKPEGNPDHPVNHGGLCLRGQAGVQGLYNPDRIGSPLRRNQRGQLEPITWPEATQVLADLLRYLRYEKQADRVALLSHRVTGSLDKLFSNWLAAYGSRRYLQYEPLDYAALRRANQLTFGTTEIPLYDIAQARFLLNFGADFLETWVSNVAFTHDFSAFRADFDRRFVHVEPRQSLTAANADEWLALPPGTEATLAFGLVHEILQAGLARGLSAGEVSELRRLVAPYDVDSVAKATEVPAATLRRLAREFAAAQPGLALGGGAGVCDEDGVNLQVAVNLLNTVCGNVGQTVRFGQGTSFDRVAAYSDVVALADAMRQEDILVALFYHTNPLFNLPATARFQQALDHVAFKVSFSPYLDETTAACDLVLPDHSPYERWEDYEPRAGVHALVQPIMRPVFDTQSTPDVLLSLSGRVAPDLAQKFPYQSFLDYLREQWKPLHRRVAPRQDFDTFWQQAVESGGVWSSPPAPRRVSLVLRSGTLDLKPAAAPASSGDQFPLMVYPSLHFYDGRGANRPWLQEIAEPMTKITWSNWVEMHPDTAQQLGLEQSDLVRLASDHGALEIPVHVYPGIRPGVLAMPLGQGHSAFGRYAQGRGANPMGLLAAAQDGPQWSGTRVRVEKTAINRKLVQTQTHDSQEGRGFALTLPLAELRQLQEKPLQPYEPLPVLYPPMEYPEHRWGLAIDHNACVGCNACIAACYAENNLPVVGPVQTDRGRHMDWIRVERYYEPAPPSAGGAGSYPDARFTVMLCQQCDNAPCESVCPVYATYHNREGLNVQVYNRCVGTRYCSNNCPYKVRRFNWLDWEWPTPLDLQLNPDLSVRNKGVMEKCTFCIQRIRAGKDHAKDEKRPVRDGEITPACAQACPAHAIVFGDLKDPQSRVSRLAQDRRRYQILADLNTKPAVTYLKRVTRPPAPARVPPEES